MATDLTSIFGNEINVLAEPRKIDRQYRSFAGANGLVSRSMGHRGRPLVVTGLLRGSSSSNYNTARGSLQDIIDDIDTIMRATEEEDFSFAGQTYYDVVWDDFKIIKDSSNNYFQLTAGGACMVRFIATGRLLNG